MSSRLDFDYDSSRSNLDLRDPRLKRIMLRDPDRCATLSEYAEATGMAIEEVLEALEHYLDDSSMSLEMAGNEVFIHTGPNGREPGSLTINVPPNLWEQLRIRSDVDAAHSLWQLIRDMERVGWVIEHRLSRITALLGPLQEQPYIGVMTGHVVVPALLFPSPQVLGSRMGLLEQYEHAGATAVAVVCTEGSLDRVVTAVRRWILDRRLAPEMNVLVLEAPQYNPVMLSPGDGAVKPVAIMRDNLGDYFW
jgi:hypothetical protein